MLKKGWWQGAGGVKWIAFDWTFLLFHSVLTCVIVYMYQQSYIVIVVRVLLLVKIGVSAFHLGIITYKLNPLHSWLR